MIYDCLMFVDEYDLLELRLRVLGDVVDRFVLTEAPLTYTGNPKPLNFAERRDRFAPWLDKITYVCVEDCPPFNGNPWDTEAWQRNAASRGLPNLQDSDVVVIADADEICNPETLVLPLSGVTILAMRSCQYWLNWASAAEWLGAIALPGYRARHGHLYGWRFASTLPLTTQGKMLSDRLLGEEPRLRRAAGWHFSRTGGAAAIVRRLGEYSHENLNAPPYNTPAYAEDCMRLKRHFLTGERLKKLAPNELPQEVVQHPERYASLVRE